LKGMLVTVGTGEGVHEGIAQAIESANPEVIAFVVTLDSRVTLDKVVDALRDRGCAEAADLCAAADGDGLVVEARNPESLDSCYEAAVRALGLLEERGACMSRAVVDFTSGTKAMSAGAALAAVRYQCGRVSYVGGCRRDSNGRVMRGTECVRTETACLVARDLAVRDLVEAFNSRQFDACRAIIERLRARMSEELLREVNLLAVAVGFYDAWEKFDHEKAAKLCADLKGFDRAWNVDTAQNRDIVSRIAKAREKARNEERDPGRRLVRLCTSCGPAILADLLANARRRGEEHRWDDAVARLYRLVELAAQVVLAKKYGIATSDVSRDFLARKGLLSKYEVRGEGRVRLGQKQAYGLLADLGEEIGRAYQSESRLQEHLPARNDSILAHGLDPVGSGVYESLFADARSLCEKAEPAEVLARELTRCEFPRLMMPRV